MITLDSNNHDVRLDTDLAVTRSFVIRARDGSRSSQVLLHASCIMSDSEPSPETVSYGPGRTSQGLHSINKVYPTSVKW